MTDAHASSSKFSPGRILTLNTIAFTVCFAVWLMYGVLIKFLTSEGLYSWSASEVGMLIAAPILTGAIMRLPVGLLTDKFGGRPVYLGVLLLSALGSVSVYFADSFWGFLICGLAFGLAGASFAVGIAFTSIWFKKENQGFALGIFGAGNAGAALTLMGGPQVLKVLTHGGAQPDGWRLFPLIYSAALLVTAGFFWFLTENKLAASGAQKSLSARLAPLRDVQVWRFGFYYVLLFGCFVGLSGWLLKYYVDVYQVSLQTAGLLAATFSLPSSIVRAGGGWLSDKVGARTVMYWVLSICLFASIAISMPLGLVPFTMLIIGLGVAMGIGMAAVYKHIPVYFPKEVGIVGGMVGVLGGLGGFVSPLVFGYLLTATTSPQNPTGVWTTAGLFLAIISAVCLAWMHLAIKRIESARVPIGVHPQAA